MKKYFNELFKADGNVRNHYKKVLEHWSTLSASKRQALHQQSIRLFSGDYAQDPFPRILTHAEFHFLQRGVEQRAKAILAFLRDYQIHGNQWNRVMPARILADTIARHHSGNNLRMINPDLLAFPYGPDIIRDRLGRWRVVEDSAGMLGGLGDLMPSHQNLFRMIPKFRDAFSNVNGGINNPLIFFSEIAAYYLKNAKKKGGIPLLYLRSFSDEPDQETQRLAQIFAKFGIDSTTSSNRLKKLVIEEGKGGGIFLKASSKKQRVGALILHAPPEHFDGHVLRALVKKFRDTSKSTNIDVLTRLVRELDAPSLQTALLKGQAWTNFSPGVQFVNDKVFGLFVDSMIRRFLKETPLLESIPAQSAAIRTRGRGWRLDRAIIVKLRRNKDGYVVKQVDNDGGSGVWIGQKETKKSLEILFEKLAATPEKYIIQEFEHLSVLDNRIVDLRIHAHVDSEHIIVSNTPWGRANWIQGDGKVNIGSEGFVSPVVVMRKKGQSCLK